jgi:hypothetical protein
VTRIEQFEYDRRIVDRAVDRPDIKSRAFHGNPSRLLDCHGRWIGEQLDKSARGIEDGFAVDLADFAEAQPLGIARHLNESEVRFEKAPLPACTGAGALLVFFRCDHRG